MADFTSSVSGSDAEATRKGFSGGTDRLTSPEATFERIWPQALEMGITRCADVTGLDRVGIPVVNVYRPNSRSLCVSQGKGASLAEARVSGLMEAVELFHAETFSAPLLLGSYRELSRRHAVIAPDGLPRLSVSRFSEDLPLLWSVGTDVTSGASLLVPYELVHTDFRLPLATGSGAFLMSTNGLASGNHLLEAVSHAICELVERDASTLWHLSDESRQALTRVDLATIDDPLCREALALFEQAGVNVGVWETTSRVGLAAFLVSIVDRDRFLLRPMPPISGAGCHPRRRIALLRALTEAAQGRLTVISGARDDLSERSFDTRQARASADRLRLVLENSGPLRSFHDAPDAAHETFEQDVQWELSRLVEAGFEQVVTVNLTRPDLRIPVVRVLIPHLEAMCEVQGFVPGPRIRGRLAELSP